MQKFGANAVATSHNLQFHSRMAKINILVQFNCMKCLRNLKVNNIQLYTAGDIFNFIQLALKTTKFEIQYHNIAMEIIV